MPKFKIPDGFEVPPEVDEDGKFTVVAVLKDHGDGNLSLLEIDGSKIKGYDDDEKKEEPSNAYSRAKAMGFKMKGEP